MTNWILQSPSGHRAVSCARAICLAINWEKPRSVTTQAETMSAYVVASSTARTAVGWGTKSETATANATILDATLRTIGMGSYG